MKYLNDYQIDLVYKMSEGESFRKMGLDVKQKNWMIEQRYKCLNGDGFGSETLKLLNLYRTAYIKTVLKK